MPVLLARIDTGNYGADQLALAATGTAGADPNYLATLAKRWLMRAMFQGAVGRVDFMADGLRGALTPQGVITLGTTITGAVGATIAGTLVTVTAVANTFFDYVAQTQMLLVNAINASAALAPTIVAQPGSVYGTVLLKYWLPGTVGNATTLVASGTGVTVSGATFGAVAPGTAQTAQTALASTVNALP